MRRPGQGDARLVARDGLLACLERAARGKVTIISAPAGSGKSSLLRAWAGQLSRPDRLAVVQVHRDQIRNIYAKLGADDRSAAVQRARQLRLLSGAALATSSVRSASASDVTPLTQDAGRQLR